MNAPTVMSLIVLLIVLQKMNTRAVVSLVVLFDVLQIGKAQSCVRFYIIHLRTIEPTLAAVQALLNQERIPTR